MQYVATTFIAVPVNLSVGVCARDCGLYVIDLVEVVHSAIAKMNFVNDSICSLCF